LLWLFSQGYCAILPDRFSEYFFRLEGWKVEILLIGWRLQ